MISIIGRIIVEAIYKVNNIIWGPIFISVMLIAGVFFTFKSHFFQFRYLHKCLGLIFKSDNSVGENKISAFAALSTALAGAMGTGNIVGVSCALAIGGAGSVFWMFVASLLGMMTIFAENALAILYREKGIDNKFSGGPMYYMSRGLNSKGLAIIFCLACIGSSLSMGNMTQANSLAIALNLSFGIPGIITAIILSLLTGLVILGGVNRIVSITEKIIPLITLFFILASLAVILKNRENLSFALQSVFKQAFSLKAAAGGAGGFMMANAIKQGISKGIFSNEAGLGSSPIVYSESEIKSPIEAGMWGIIQVFIDTIVGCTLTAFCILAYKADGIFYGDGGLDLCVEAFSTVFGKYAGIIVSLCVVIFAFATIISWSYYGEKSLIFLGGKNFIKIYKLIYCLFAAIACLLSLNTVWNIADIFNACMAIPNVIAIMLLSKQVFEIIEKWEGKI